LHGPRDSATVRSTRRSCGVKVGVVRLPKVPASNGVSCVSAITRVMSEVEQVHQVADRGAIHRPVRIAAQRHRVRQVVAAAARDGRQVPVALDEFQQRHVIVVRVIDEALLRER